MRRLGATNLLPLLKPLSSRLFPRFSFPFIPLESDLHFSCHCCDKVCLASARQGVLNARCLWECLKDEKTRNHGGRENVEHDLISSLPDEVLTHILSFLITKEAVQTCVLSKSWKTTWAAVPILNIKPMDFVEFEDYYCSTFVDCYEGCNEASKMSVARFERFMTGFLDNRAPTNLQRVCCHREFHRWETHAFIGWLDRVLLLMPLQINIIINCYGGISVDMPDLVFSSACLQHLSMSLYTNVKIIIRPVSINLPSLKFLELNCVELPDDFSQKLFMGCPSLERLELSRCDLYFSGISSQVLKELTLHFCDLHEQMQISCPNLVFMRIHLQSGGISLKNMSSLVDVVIILYQDLGSAEVPVLNFFGCLSNVAKLKLHLETLVLKEQLEKDISNCRNFNNLKKLVVAGKWDMSHDFYLIACLLKHSPNLKELRLLLFNESQCETQEPPQEVSGGVLFQHEYLETVKIGHMYMGILSPELIDAMIKLLGSYVKEIGNVIIT